MTDLPHLVAGRVIADPGIIGRPWERVCVRSAGVLAHRVARGDKISYPHPGDPSRRLVADRRLIGADRLTVAERSASPASPMPGAIAIIATAKQRVTFKGGNAAFSPEPYHTE